MISPKHSRDADAASESSPPKRQQQYLDLVMPAGYYSVEERNETGHVIAVHARKYGNPDVHVNIYRMFWDDGMLMGEATWNETTSTGKISCWREDGTLRHEGEFLGLEGEMIDAGCMKYYDRKGQLETLRNLNDKGEKHGIELWYRDGVLRNMTSYENGVQDGVHRYWNEARELMVEESYRKGRLHGPQRKRQPDGTYQLIDHCGNGPIEPQYRRMSTGFYELIEDYEGKVVGLVGNSGGVYTIHSYELQLGSLSAENNPMLCPPK